MEYKPHEMNAVTCSTDSFYLGEYRSSIIHEYNYNLRERRRLNVMHIGPEDYIFGLWQLRKDWILVANGNMQTNLVTDLYLFLAENCYLDIIGRWTRSTETKYVKQYFCF